MPARNGTARSRSPDVASPAGDILPVNLINTCFGLAQLVPAEHSDQNGRTEPAVQRELSMRAINVLRLIAEELVGEIPPGDDWMPSNELLRKITVERLSIARNCGPRTVKEIVSWAEARGVTIQPRFHAGKSLSETWRDLGAKSASGQLTKAELAEALEKSVRRKSTKVPVAIQRILLKYLSRMADDPTHG
jgi:hypothetical protein